MLAEPDSVETEKYSIMEPCKVTEFAGLDWKVSRLDPISRRGPFCFCDSAWLGAWDGAFLEGKHWHRPINAYAVMVDGSPLGFLTLAQQDVYGFRIKSLAGYYWPCRTMAVGDDERTHAQFAGAIADHFTSHPPGMVLRFGPVSSADRAMDRLVRSLHARGWHVVRRKTGDVYELVLPSDPGELESRIAKSLLKNLHYRHRRLLKSGASIVCERHVLGPHCDGLLDTLARIEATSWVNQRGEPKFCGRVNQAFWIALAQAEGRSAEAVIWVMHCSDTPVAFQVHIETADTIYIIANSYDESWRVYSPGSLLSLEAFRDACRRGKVRVEWGQGDSGYKSSWGATCGLTELFDVILFRPGAVGSVLNWLAGRWVGGWQRAYDG